MVEPRALHRLWGCLVYRVKSLLVYFLGWGVGALAAGPCLLNKKYGLSMVCAVLGVPLVHSQYKLQTYAKINTLHKYV